MENNKQLLGHNKGFTLVELLVATGLMIIVIVTVTAIFSSSSNTASDLQAASQLYKQARYALDIMEKDISSADPFDGNQSLVLINGYYDKSTGEITEDSGEGQPPEIHLIRAADKIKFRANIAVADSIQHAEVWYYLVPLKKQDQSPVKTRRTKTPLFKLVRRIALQDPESSELTFNQPPVDSQGRQLPTEQTVCDNVISFNIEYYSNDARFSQLVPSPCPVNDPLGDNDIKGGTNDTGDTAYSITAIRVSLVITESTNEINVKHFSRVINFKLE